MELTTDDVLDGKKLTDDKTMDLYKAIYAREEVECPFCKEGVIGISGRRKIKRGCRHAGNTYRFSCRKCRKEFFGDHVWHSAQ